MKLITAFLALLLAAPAGAQKIIEQYTPQKDSLRIGTGKGDFLPYNEKGYTLILPDTAQDVKGVIVSLEDRRFDLKGDPKQQIHQEATAKGLAVLYISTGIPVDLFFSPRSLQYTDSVLNRVLTSHRLADKGLYFLGVNLAGHRALKYIAYTHGRKGAANGNIKGVVLCEGVLDWVRQWYEGKKAVRDNFAESSVFEGRMVTYLLEKHLGGTPTTALQQYLDFSSYSYFDDKNRYLRYYKDFAVRAYSEPATLYWLEAKRKTTWDTNFPDQVGIINELKLAGNTRAELHLFEQDKSNMDRRNPAYTWGLVDKAELVAWMLKGLN